MSVAARKWVRRHSPAKGTRKTVLAELAWAGDDAGQGARLSQRQLVEATGLSRNTVQRALADLEAGQFIVRHRGGRSHCTACRTADRRVVVFDVVMPELTDESNPDQLDLLNGPTDRPHVGPIAASEKPQGGADIGPRVGPLEDIEDDHKKEKRAGEKDSELACTVESVIEILGRVEKPGWHVDRIAIEAHVMTWSSFRDPLRAAAAVVGAAHDHHWTNAARLFQWALEHQPPLATRPERSPSSPRRPGRASDATSARRAAALAELAGLGRAG